MSETWKDLVRADELGPGEGRRVEVDGLGIGVVNLDGEYHAFLDLCTHEALPILGSGEAIEDLIDGDELTCPRHGASFCIRTGEALCAPAYEPLTRYEVRVRDGVVQARIEA